MRQLSTIGDLHAARPAARSRSRRASMGSITYTGIGQTNTAFVPPSPGQMATNPPGDALAAAANALLIYIQHNGTPSMHEDNQTVLQFQTAWNADPLSDSNGANSQLSEDGGYGPNTHAALASLGGTAPAVNPGPVPAVTPPIPPPAPGPGPLPMPPVPHPLVHPSTTPTASHTGVWVLLAAAGIAAYLLLRKKKRSTGSVIVKTNPRRRRRRRNLLAA